MSERRPPRQRQGARDLRARRRPPAARRERPHLDLRRRLADRDPRQGPRAHRALRLLVRAHGGDRAQPPARAAATTGARPSAAGWRCSRSSAWCAATSPARAGRTTSATGEVCGHRLPDGLRESRAAAGADLHARDEGAERPRREHRPRGGGRAGRRGALRRGRAAVARALRARRLGVRAASAGSSWPTRSSSSGSTTTAGSSSATRRSRPIRPASGRPTSTRPGVPPPSFDKQFVRDYCETLGWDKTLPGPGAARRCRRRHARALRRGVRAADRARASTATSTTRRCVLAWGNGARPAEAGHPRSAGPGRRERAAPLGFAVGDARVGRLVDVELDTEDAERGARAVERMCEQLLTNPLIESYEIEFAAG